MAVARRAAHLEHWSGRAVVPRYLELVERVSLQKKRTSSAPFSAAPT
jgi:hypothetical protein